MAENMNMQNTDGAVADPVTAASQPEEKKTRKKAAPVEEERVEIFIPRGQANDDPNFFVSVNGVNFLLPKGKKSMVPKYVAEEISRAFEAQELYEQKKEELLEAAKQLQQ